jgi:hypothetical protein
MVEVETSLGQLDTVGQLDCRVITSAAGGEHVSPFVSLLHVW